jgi:hypothetical protein
MSYSNLRSCFNSGTWDKTLGTNGGGNIDIAPLLTPDGHLPFWSPCIDKGDPNFIIDPNYPTDVDGEDRLMSGRVDIGADEFEDTDGDGLPDFWEQMFFGDSNIADPNGDPDGDGIVNLYEYKLFSSQPNTPPLTVPVQYPSIQAGIDAASDGDTVLVAAGTYTGTGNKNLIFGGKAVILNAPDGPATTIIDCESSGRAFNFSSYGWNSGETPATAVVGFTLTNGYAYAVNPDSALNRGGAILCLNSSPQIRNCMIINNSANDVGGGIYGYLSHPVIADCTVTDNEPNGIWMEYGSARIEGNVELSGNDWNGYNLMLYNDLYHNGKVIIAPDVRLYLNDSRIRCDISGQGTIWVTHESELIIESDAEINLYGEVVNGRIICNGLLRLRESAKVLNAQVTVNRASFEDDVIIMNSVITAEAGMPYGQFYIEDDVQIWLDSIEADGDRYLDLDPSEFDVTNIHVDTIDINITEGVANTRGGLFELRGKPDLVSSFSCDPNNEFFCQADPGTITVFNTDYWTINSLELIDDAKLNLTNRFDFQEPYDSGGDEEVLYVKNLVMKPGSVLNTAFQHIYYETLDMHPTAKVVNVPLLGFSLVNISFDNEIDYLTRINHNNYIHPSNPAYDRIHVQRVTGELPDLKGMIRMCNLRDLDPDSAPPGQLYNARAKGLFSKSNEEVILVLFEYLFDYDPNFIDRSEVELIVCLSEDPELTDNRIEVGRLKAPPEGRPGSVGSGRFGTFRKYVNTQGLNFLRGTRIELELLGPDGTCVYINNFDPQVICRADYCSDVTGDAQVTILDYLTVLGEFGTEAEILQDDGKARTCLESIFTEDGFVDWNDVISWNWIVGQLGRDAIGHLCRGEITLTSSNPGSPSVTQVSSGLTELSGELLIAGKHAVSNAQLEDKLYAFDQAGTYQRSDRSIFDFANSRLIQDTEGGLYQLNLQAGVVPLADAISILSPCQLSTSSDPRYGVPSDVLVGLQSSGDNWTGRPILDVALDNTGHAYVLPVVVDPNGAGDPYLAVARLLLSTDPNTAPTLVTLYDDPLQEGDNQQRDALRELEITDDGYLYVINAHTDNESSILWAYDVTNSLPQVRVELGEPNTPTYIPSPAGLYASQFSDHLYAASSLNAPEAASTTLYKISRSDFSVIPIEIPDFGHITGITEDPSLGTLWISGFLLFDIPDTTLYEYDDLSYDPYLAQVSASGVVEDVICLTDSDPNNDLALPVSIQWVGATTVDPCQGADIDDSGDVGLGDLVMMAQAWLSSPPDGNWDTACDLALPVNNHIDLMDLSVLSQCWEDGSEVDPCQGADIDDNGDVGLGDLVMMAQAWLSGPGDGNWNTACDLALPADKIDLRDFEVVSQNWLEGGCR